MVVHWSLGARRHDERKETERAVLGAVQRVLADAAAHPASVVGSGAMFRQPAVAAKQPRERGSQRLNPGRVIVDGGAKAFGFVDQRADFRRVDDISKPVLR